MTTKPLSLLLVEGDADEAAIVERHLTAPGAPETFSVKTAFRLSTALHLLARESFDAALLDVALPQSVGLEAFRRIREQKPELAIVVVSGLHDEELAREAVRLGAQDYLIKGTLDCCLLKRTLRHAVELKRLALSLETALARDEEGRVVVDSAGAVLWANAAASVLLGTAPDQLAAKPFPHDLGDGTPRRVALAAERAGTLSWAEIAWRGETARLVRLRDVTDAERLARLGSEADETLRAAEIKEQFMGRVSHELRNSLAAIKTAAFCLGDGVGGGLAPRQAQLVEMISRNVDRQTRIVNNLLDLAKFRSGRLDLELMPLRLGDVLAEAAREVQVRGDARLTLDLAESLPAVQADGDLLLQVLRNLLDNALRHARSKVVLSAAAGLEAVTFSVADDGPGIPADRLRELFKPFARLTPAAPGPRKGVGLGLSICKEIVDGHGGRIWCESGPGGGARFTVSLPRLETRRRDAARRPRGQSSQLVQK